MKSPSIESSVTVPSHEGSKLKNSLRSGLFTTICWSAVLAGVAIAVSVQLVLMMLGVASGVALANLAVGETLGYGALMWASGSMLIAAFVGAYVAGRMSGLRRKIDGVLHGVISWAVSILLALILATTTGGSLISGLLSNVIQGGIVVAPSGANVTSILNRQLGPNIAIDELKRLHEMGIELQIDDFGTGYSSLSKLQSLDIDVVKIDQSFVYKLATDHQSRALCETIVSIGRSLDIAIVAEGVETTEQLKILQAMNCDEVQGYLISRPVPPDDIPALLTKKFF